MPLRSRETIIIEFCQKIKQDPSQLYRIWFSDGVGYNLQEARKKVWTQEDHFSDEKADNQRPGVWAVISAFGVITLKVYEDNLRSDKYL